MYISQVTLRNIKGFHGAREVDLDLTAPGWTVIAGRNGSGKTTLLRAIALAIAGPGLARTLMPDFDNWVSIGSDRGSASVAIAGAQPVDHLADPLGPPRVAELHWGAGSLLVDLQKGGPYNGPWLLKPRGWFCAAYGPFRRLAGGSNDVQRLMGKPGVLARLTSLFHEDASLAEGVTWLIRQHLRELEGHADAALLKRAALNLLGDGLLPDHYRIDRVDSDGLWVFGGEHHFPLREMSDGYRSVVALVVDLVKQLHECYGELTTNGTSVTAPGVVIIDEVDAHLHVSWQKAIGGWLKAHFPNIQFIVTTHSPYVCQAADPGGLIRLPGPQENSAPQVVDDDLYERVVYGSGDDAVLSELFGLETPYSDQAVKLRSELVDLEVAVISGTATEEQTRRYDELKETLTSSPSARAREVEARLGRTET
ncbi:AAA family ATPase [Umezawaea endophytica]|uniref:AAA family ATPase n=1 Tax=Umezawaea endophytica TaxID=1654476 RepID=A0A9X2ZYN1_9PSEU|nr:AAA family ATPase [Umezawaea endophytica]MCS7476624.1 AAA family ATPase [Umezawaea endophytica]